MRAGAAIVAAQERRPRADTREDRRSVRAIRAQARLKGSAIREIRAAIRGAISADSRRRSAILYAANGAAIADLSPPYAEN